MFRKAKLFESMESQKEKEKEEKFRKENYERKRSKFSEGKFDKDEEEDKPKVRPIIEFLCYACAVVCGSVASYFSKFYASSTN
jgi:hypothetical protein